MIPCVGRIAGLLGRMAALLLLFPMAFCSPPGAPPWVGDDSNFAEREPDLASSGSNDGPTGFGLFANRNTIQTDDDAAGTGNEPGGYASNQVDPADVLAVLQQDSDGDGTIDLAELVNGTDPFDPRSGGDIDGDGIENREDPDVDGDGLANGEDPDVDGDGIPNGADDDIDGDGLLAPEDDDDDGDGVPDVIDNDDNGDGENDCGCQHGTCSVFGGQCFCDDGWEGEDCDKFHCRDLEKCNNGTCVGPNVCRCNPGWESRGNSPCSTFHCRDLRNCNGHGTCIGANKCQCDPDWNGIEDCSIATCDRDPAFCDDGDPCTVDECDPHSGCSHSPKCLEREACVRGTCTIACKDASDCAEGHGCFRGGCLPCGNDADCRDADPCTIDHCNPLSVCTNDPRPCTSPETCVLGKCVADCAENGICDSGFSCRDDGCFEECDSDSDCDSETEKCNGATADGGGVCIPKDQEEDPEDEEEGGGEGVGP